MPGCHLPALFLEELGSQEVGKEAFRKDLRAWRNNLSALLSPLTQKKCHSAYICKKAIAIFMNLNTKKEFVIKEIVRCLIPLGRKTALKILFCFILLIPRLFYNLVYK